MQVYDVLQYYSKLIGVTIAIEGIFVLKKEASYIAASEDEINSPTKAIGVRIEDLKKRLLSTVPALGGSQFSWFNRSR